MAVGRVILRVLGFGYVSVIPPSVVAHLDVNTDITRREPAHRAVLGTALFLVIKVK